MNRYEYDIDVNDDSVAARIIRLVGYDKRVLELGCSSGHMSRIFRDRGCTVVGIEYDAKTAEQARLYCEDVYQINLDEDNWSEYLAKLNKFDVIVAADVLEHLRDPQACIGQMRRLLVDDGVLVISTPNIAHGGVIASLLQGQFNYRNTGLLDRTHIHFFTEQSMRNSLENEGFTVVHYSPVNADQYHPEFAGHWQQLPTHLQQALSDLPSAQPFQLVFSAVYKSMSQPIVASQLETLRQLNESRAQSRILKDELLGIQQRFEALEILSNDQSGSLQLNQKEIESLNELIKELTPFELLHEKAEAAYRQSEMALQHTQVALSDKSSQYEVLVHRLAGAEQRIANFYASPSWRITAPLRLILRIAKKLVRPVKKTLRASYSVFPAGLRISIKNALFSTFPFLFKHTYQYRSWVAQDKFASMNTGSANVISDNVYPLSPRSFIEDKSMHEPLQFSEPIQECGIKAIAFYLPQFHPIAENDEWWGKGFTEWTNVAKAVPQFEGHYQPHQPGELGFYDLRLPEVLKRQTELAKLAGLSGFCFHYYWFGGRRLLERPLDLYVAQKDIDFPFCICWANENWSRRWDGSESDILMAQTHTPETDEAFIRDITPLLLDDRYIRVDNKPIIILYRAEILPNAIETAARWRKYFAEHGHGELYLVVAQSFGVEDPRDYGFDAAVEFPPHRIPLDSVTGEQRIFNPNYAGNIYDYNQLADASAKRWSSDYIVHKTVVPSWDNEARKPGRGHSLINSSPTAYANWLKSVCEETKCRYPSEQRLVFINAWNEWAEGAHLEPDRRYGYAWLNRTREVLSPFAKVVENEDQLLKCEKGNNSAVIIHLYYPELFAELSEKLVLMSNQLDFYFSVRPESLSSSQVMIKKVFPSAVVVAYANHGRDIVPFLRIYSRIKDFGYKAICKLHSKKSIHRVDGEAWRKDIYQSLIGSPQLIERHISRIQSNIDGVAVGVIGPAGHIVNGETYWALNKDRTCALAQRFGCEPDLLENFTFVAGTMFWFKPEALVPLLSLGLDPVEFELEHGQKDGTLAHAVERLIGLSCIHAGMRLEDSNGEDSFTSQYLFAHPQPA